MRHCFIYLCILEKVMKKDWKLGKGSVDIVLIVTGDEVPLLMIKKLGKYWGKRN